MTLLRSVVLLGLVFSGISSIPTASAQAGTHSQYGQGDFGVGLMIGSPTGITAKKYLAEQHAVDAALGWGYGGSHFHADYLYEKKDVLGESEARLGWFVGIGGQVQMERNRNGYYYNRRYHRDDYRRDRNYLHLGARVPLGLELRFQSLPKFEFFGEVALGFEIIEYPGPTLDGGIGTRFYF
jgi:hypothetical protein